MLLVLVLSCSISMVVGSGGFNFSLAAWWARRMARGISMTANRIIVLVGISFFRFIFLFVVRSLVARGLTTPAVPLVRGLTPS